MTLEQIFYWFCKKEKVFTLVKQLVNIRISYWNKYKSKTDEPWNPSTYFYNILSRGNDNFIATLLGFWGSYSLYQQYPVFRNVCRRWNYFVKHNIFLKDDCLKIGDKINYSTYWNKEHGKIVSIVNPFIVNTNERNNVKIYSIYKVNNETPNISWYIKRNRETYGLD